MTRSRPGGRSRVAAWALAGVPLAFLAVMFAWPLVAVTFRAVWGGGLGGEDAGLRVGEVASAAGTTLALAGAGAFLSLAVGLPAAWALHRRSWVGARTISSLLSAPFALPTIVVALAVLAVQRDLAPGLGAFNGVPGIVLALAFFNVAVVLRFVGPALEGLDPRLEAAARTLGASTSQTTRAVVWPHISRAVLNAGAVAFLFCATSFALVLILGGTRVQTLEVATYLELTTFVNLPGAALLALVQALMVLAAATVVWRIGAYPGSAPTLSRRDANRAEALRTVLLLLPAVVLAAVPTVALVVRSLEVRGGWSLAHYGAVFSSQPPTPGVPALGDAVIISIVLALVATVVTITIAALVVAAGHVWSGLRWLRVAALAPLAVSSVVVGLGLLVGLGVHVGVRDAAVNLALLVSAQVLIALPLVVRVLGSGFDALDTRMLAAARTLGANGVNVAFRVAAPLMRPAAISAAGLAFAVAVGEFGASVFVIRPGEPTLPTVIARLLGRPGSDSVGQAMAAAVVLGIIVAAAMMLADRMGRRQTKVTRR